MRKGHQSSIRLFRFDFFDFGLATISWDHTKTACKQLSSQQSRICLKITKRQIVLPIQTIYLGFRASKHLRIYYEIFKSHKKFHNCSTVFIQYRILSSNWVYAFYISD